MPALPSYRNQSIDLQLICTANQLTGFFMSATLALNGLNGGKNESTFAKIFTQGHPFRT